MLEELCLSCMLLREGVLEGFTTLKKLSCRCHEIEVEEISELIIMCPEIQEIIAYCKGDSKKSEVFKTLAELLRSRSHIKLTLRLDVMGFGVGVRMSSVKCEDNTVMKLLFELSEWKLRTTDFYFKHYYKSFEFEKFQLELIRRLKECRRRYEDFLAQL